MQGNALKPGGLLHKGTKTTIMLRSVIGNCEIPEEEYSEALDCMLSKYCNEEKPALDFMKNCKVKNFMNYEKTQRPIPLKDPPMLRIPLRHKRTESAGSQDRTKVLSVSGLGLTPSHAIKTEVVNRSTRLVLDTTARTFGLVLLCQAEF